MLDSLCCLDKPKSNINILDSLVTESIILLKNKLDSLNINNICLEFHNHIADFYIEKHILSNINKIKVFKAPCSNDTSKQKFTLDVIIDKLSVEYSRIETNKALLLRNINISLTFTIISPNSSILLFPVFTSKYSDTVRLSDVKSIEANHYDFAKGSLPEEEPSFLSKILEPVVVIGSAIVTLVLLFTIRSN